MIDIVPRGERVKSAIEHLIHSNLVPGSLVPVSMLESILGVGRDTQAFGFMISEIRRSLFSVGKYLSGEGLEQKEAYEVLHERDNHWMARLAMARMDRSLEGMQELLSKTNMSEFSSLEKTRHESALREVCLRMRVLKRGSE